MKSNPSYMGSFFHFFALTGENKYICIMKNLFSFSRRDRNGLMLLMILIVASTGVAGLFSYRSLQEKKKQQEFLLCSSRYLAELQVVGIELPKTRTVNLPVGSDFNSLPVCEKVPQEEEVILIEINSADSVDLVSLPGIGKVFAARIMKYRNMLGGFYDPNQLMEVYGFDAEKFLKLENRITINAGLISKINVNTEEFKVVLKHPYIDYDMTKRIFNARNKKPFDNADDLANRASIPDSIIVKVRHYLDF